MQVFMPYASLEQSVRCLDKSRLGNQVWREAKTLLNGGWKHHPAAKLWADYKPALAQYCLYGLQELGRRGDISYQKRCQLAQYFVQFTKHEIIIPPFVGYEPFHASHRLNLLWKYPTYYSNIFSEPVPLTQPAYVWPLKML